MGILDGFFSLGRDTNKTKGGNTEEDKQGIGSTIPELSLDMPDEDLLGLTKKWKQRWDDSEVKSEWEKAYTDAERYWKGQQFSNLEVENHALMDNAIFEALETFLPQATRRNPEAQVELAQEQPEPQPGVPPQPNDPQEFADAVEQNLATLADSLKLRLKIKKATRHWAIYKLGVVKVGWSQVTKDISLKVVRPTRLILDPDGTVDEDGYTGEYIGEYKTETAGLLIRRFPDAKEEITKAVDEKLGTDVTYIEWNTDEYVCWTYKDKVLGKSKNVNWNYENEAPPTQTVDEFGNSSQAPAPVHNHFVAPRIPYIFLSIYNLGKGPIDDTGLIQQNLPLQDLVNKRLRQIDKNADSMNGGLAVSGDNFSLEQSKDVSDTARKGGTFWVPTGPVGDAIQRITADPLPPDVFTQLADTRVRLADVFGTRGLTASGIQGDTTVRGKIITKGVDTDRIGGGVTEYLEQFADDIYNWFVQLMFVYYPLQNIPDAKLKVSVKEGSLLPKDNVSLANQAIELATAQLLDPITLFEKLEYPNPEETAKRLYLWMNAPDMLFANDPEIQALVAAKAQAAAAATATDTAAKATDHQNTMDGKAADHASKLELQTKKQEGDLLNQVPVQ